MFYVYEWYIKETGEVIYVGKGTHNRYKVRKHNRLFNYFINNYDCESKIIKEFENEKDAFLYEYERIEELKKKGQCICNIAKGGYGGSVEWWTDELKQKYSENNVMKSENQRKRMSAHNPMKNKETAKKVAKAKSRAVVIDDTMYYSVKEAMNKYNTSYETIANWCRKGINIYGEKCRFFDTEQVEFTDKRYNKCGSKAVVFRGKTYECVKDLVDDIGFAENTVHSWLRRGFNPKGEPCRYVDDDRQLTFVDRHIVRNKNRAKPIIVNGVKYRSCEEASKKLNIPKTTIYAYLQGNRHSTKYICTYDNQQPSHGNTDNSTVEGSTTNG